MPCKADEVSAERHDPASFAPADAEWVATDDGLAAAAERWSRTIGLDSEFQRTDTFFPRPGLYQIASGSDLYLLDPLALGDFSPLLELLEDRRITKIMHACSEDLELLRHHIGAVPVRLFDTQLANAFVSGDYSVSFARLVEERLGIELVQHETRSDWLARPLSEEQIRYACEDVHYLPPLHDALTEDLERLGRLDWFREEMDQRGRFEPADPERYYLGMRKAWRLPAAVRVRLRSLAAWREHQAMAEDRPRGRVVRDEHLLELAGRDTLTDADIGGVLPRGVARRYGPDLLAAWHDADSAAGRDDEPPEADAPLGAAATNLARELRELAISEARALGMAPELLGRKREVEACVRHYQSNGELSGAFQGWRRPIVGERFLARLGGRA